VRVVLTGASGLVGTALAAALERRGDEVVRLVRREARGNDERRWDPATGRLDPDALQGAAAVVHLAGAGIGDQRWTAHRKAEVRDSRIRGTTLLAEAIAGAPAAVPVWVSGSAVGWYGDRGDEELDEDSEPGSDYLADLCRDWEAATTPAAAAGTRVALLRTGIVLSPHGGALARQLPLFRLGVGGRLGSGRQWVSWIALPDQVGAILHALDHPEVAGPFNATAPNPVTNAELTAALASAVHRPAVLAVPRLALQVALGRELTDVALLASQRVHPSRLLASGYRFAHPDLGPALRALLAA
jgi:uncharacterized protein (TIGR01777 family)